MITFVGAPSVFGGADERSAASSARDGGRGRTGGGGFFRIAGNWALRFGSFDAKIENCHGLVGERKFYSRNS